jgi:predicted DNA-binding transcriptional regulator AlpA
MTREASRLMRLAEAAHYCGLTSSEFLTELEVGTFPAPFGLARSGRAVWDRQAIDAAIDGRSKADDDLEIRRQAWQADHKFLKDSRGRVIGIREGFAERSAARKAKLK